MTTVVGARRRLDGIDRLRGLAVLLMVVDHVLVFALVVAELDGPAGTGAVLLRSTVTRASLPLFGVLAGFGLVFSARHRSFIDGVQVPPRQLLAAAVLAVTPTAILGLGTPDVLAQFVVLIGGLGWAIRRWPLAIGCLGVVQAITWPVAGTGYQPGVLVALMAFGVLYSTGGRYLAAEVVGCRLPGWLEVPGRRPVEWYVGHVLVLFVVAALW